MRISLAFPETVVKTSSKQNQLFAQYSVEHPRREQELSAWNYLKKICRSDSFFFDKQTPLKVIEQET